MSNRGDQRPIWSSRVASDKKETMQNAVNQGDVSSAPAYSGVTEASSGVQKTNSLISSGSEAKALNDIYAALSDVELIPTLPMLPNSYLGYNNDMVHHNSRSKSLDLMSKELKRNEEDRLKRTRSSEIHNMSEKRRRDRIREKLKTLREMIPNCNKPDAASILDDAIKHIKALKLQVEMMSMARGAMCQSAYMQPAFTIKSAQMSPFMQMKAAHELGMGMCYSMGTLPMISLPSPLLHSLSSPPSGLPLMSAPTYRSVGNGHVPLFRSDAESAALSNFVFGYSIPASD